LTMTSENALAEAFPAAEAGIQPLGSRVLIQIRTPETKSKGGIILSTNDQDTQLWNTSVAKVIAVGPLAFRNRNSQELWPEGAWCKPGDYVRVPRYGGDRWVSDAKEGGKAYYCLYNDLDILGLVTVDPTDIKAFF
jgi:co-chaperonin GroES (HSP10)